jgi:hypothetical protein
MDMYVKMESMTLDWYSLPKHQKIIRAKLYRGIVDTLRLVRHVLPRLRKGLSYLEILMVVNMMFKLGSLML